MLTERITEAELQRLEHIQPHEELELLAKIARLVDEVRRLRGIIASFTDRAEISVARFYEGAHDGPDTQTEAMLAEARAIREESLVSVWPDSSGSGRDLTAAGPHRPTSVGAGLPLYTHHPDDRASTFGEPRLTFNEEFVGKIVRVWVNGRPFVPAIREEQGRG